MFEIILLLILLVITYVFGFVHGFRKSSFVAADVMLENAYRRVLDKIIEQKTPVDKDVLERMINEEIKELYGIEIPPRN